MDKKAKGERFDYIPTPREIEWGFYVVGTGLRIEPPKGLYQKKESSAPYQWHNGRILRDYGLVYLTEGQGYFASSEKTYTKVKAGDVLILFPGVWHNYHPDQKTGWTEQWVTFNGELPSRWKDCQLMTPGLPLCHLGIRRKLVECFEELRMVSLAKPAYANQIQSGITMKILGLMFSYQQEQANYCAGRTQSFQLCLEFIERHWRRTINFEKLATKSGLSYRQFRRLFQRVTGLPPHQYQIHLRLNEACKLIGQHPISKVATDVGFTDQFYFSRIFKAKKGVSPKNWRPI